MIRTLSRGAGIGLAMIGIFSCSEHSVTGADNFNSDDLTADAARVASVGVSFGSNSIAVGDTTRAIASLRDYQGRLLLNRTVNWTSSDTTVAKVSATGLVTGIAEGTALITASRAGKSGSGTITVTAVIGSTGTTPVSSVSVTLAANDLNPGQTTQATATTYDSANNVLTGRAISWSSTNTAIATVNAAGLVTAVAAGTSQIVATSEGKSGNAVLTVTAAQQITNPGTVTDLKVLSADSNGVTLSFTQVDDGTGKPAKYDIRYAPPPIAWGSATSATSGTCAVPVAGTAIGTSLVCRVMGLKPSTTYDFQLIAFRGTLNFDAVFGALSIVASATTTASTPLPPAPVASVTVSPATASVQVGSTVQLSATDRDANGNVLTGRVVTWSSANSSIATVNSTGLVTAVAAGTAQITATSEAKTGTATITAQAAPPPPPPGSSNEPTGMTKIAERAFNSLQESPWDTDNSLSIVQDPTAPQSPSSVIRVTFPGGFGGGNSNGHTGMQWSGGQRILYVSYWMKYSSNWWGHNTGINKQSYAWVTAGYTPFVMETEGVGSGPLKPRPILQRMIRGDGNYEPNLVPNATITRGKWFRIEIVLTGNTSGTANGAMDIYLDGVHVTSVGGLQWTTGTTGWNVFELYPVWGGIGDTVPSTMWVDWDHVYLSGK